MAGQYFEAHGIALLRAYAQPIYYGHRFDPVETAFERSTLKWLLTAERELSRANTHWRKRSTPATHDPCWCSARAEFLKMAVGAR